MRSLIESKLARLGEQVATPFAVTFPDGGQFANQDGEPEFRIVFRNARSLMRTAAFGHIGLLEGYFDGDIDVEGSLALALASGMGGGLDSAMPLVDIRNRWHEWRFGNGDRRQAKENARFHYALGHDFYKLWLDEALMMYTCGYWRARTRHREEGPRKKDEHDRREGGGSPGGSGVDIRTRVGGVNFP